MLSSVDGSDRNYLVTWFISPTYDYLWDVSKLSNLLI